METLVLITTVYFCIFATRYLVLSFSGFGLILGAYNWAHGIANGTSTPIGTLVLIAMSFLAGLQLILAFFSYDTNDTNK